MKKVTISEAVKKAKVSKISDYADSRPSIYRIDLSDHGDIIDVYADSPTDACEQAIKLLNDRDTGLLVATLKKDS